MKLHFTNHEAVDIAYEALEKATIAYVDAQVNLFGAQSALDASEKNYIALDKVKGNNAEQRKANLYTQLSHHHGRVYAAQKGLLKAQLDYDLAKLQIAKIKLHLQLQGQMIEVENMLSHVS